MAVSSWLFEKRPLKRSKLGPPDVYPQDPKQKEDELTAINVKQGFNSSPQIPDEYGSARNSNITATKFGSFFSAVLTLKQELNRFQDSGRKRQQINTKDNFWLVTARSKNYIEPWFKDLAGSKPLTVLAKKVPIFNKKDEIFMTLYEYSVPMLRAAWYIKMSSAYNVAVSEAKIKKRQPPDPSQEWTQALCKFLKEQLQKLAEHYHSSISLGSTSTTTTSSSLSSSSSLSGSGVGVNSSIGSGTSTTGSSIGGCGLNPGVTVEVAYKQWQYCVQLARHLYEEGLLDRQDFLTWILELVEKTKTPDDYITKIVFPLALQYVDEFVNSQLLSRRLAYHCAKKLNYLLCEQSTASPRCQSPPLNTNSSSAVPTSTPSSQVAFNPVTANIVEYLSCPHHRSVVIWLSSILQIITLECPSALVWNHVGEGKSGSVLNGSPLDHLPFAPSNLPMPPRPYNAQIRAQLRQAEEQIRQRGRAAEVRWSCDKWQQTALGSTIQQVLNALDALDRHSFDRVDNNNSLDTLYAKVFPSAGNKDKSSGASVGEILQQDESIIRLLCEWAVTTKRCGQHRALVVAKLLEKRQTDLTAEKFTDADTADEKDSQDSGGQVPLGLPLYQNLLVNFLDTQAPVIDEKSMPESKSAFANLVLLFAELIRYDVFSHDAYMCTLISRGSFVNAAGTQVTGNAVGIPQSNKSMSTPEPSLTGFMPDVSRGLSPGPGSGSCMGISGMPGLGMPPMGHAARQGDSLLHMFEPPDNRPSSAKHEPSWDTQMDIDEAGLDADLGKLLQNINESQQNMSDHPDSVGSDKDESTPLNVSTPLTHPPLVPCYTPGHEGPSSVSNAASISLSHYTSTSQPSTLSNTARHLLYTTHFPLPPDESSSHDCNQRHILLFGVGKVRDEARHTVKKVIKEIMKLFSKKTCMDIDDHAKVKKHAKEGFNFDSVVSRFQNLSYFDQHQVTQSCATSVIEMLSAFATGNSNYLPLVECIAFLFELMEMALNVHGLLEFAIQLLKELADVEVQLAQKNSTLAGVYATAVGLSIVGVLYTYHCFMLVSQQQTLAIFEGLCKIVKHVSSPSDCTSAERCILAYLYDMNSCCHYVKETFKKRRKGLKHDGTIDWLVIGITAQEPRGLYRAGTIDDSEPRHSEHFGNIYPKLKNLLYGSNTPSALSLLWNASYMIEYINDPKKKVNPQQIRQLNEQAHFRYSFVCNAVHSISICKDPDRLNEISILCAELTASCCALSSEWLGVLKALCCSSNHGCGFIDVLKRVDVSDLSIHDNLAVFTSILVARRCFSLQDFVVHVSLPSLLAACPAGGGDQDAESGARLTCHLLLRLFKKVESPVPGVHYLGNSPHPMASTAAAQRPHYYVKFPCDRHLLSAVHSGMRVEAVLAVLKAVLVLGDATLVINGESKSKTGSNQNKGDLNMNDMLEPVDDLDFDLVIPPLGRSQGPGSGVGKETAGLNDFAKHALKQVCSQEWVHERCLRDPEMLCTEDLLLDPVLSHQQSQHLLRMICRPKDADIPPNIYDPGDQRQLIASILQNLDLWTLRVSWLELQLMYKQCAAQNPPQVSSWLDNVAKATIDVFQVMREEGNQMKGEVLSKCSPTKFEGDKPTRIWLVAPLIAKLPAAVQGKMLQAAGQVLESGSWSASSATSNSSSSASSKNKERERQAQKNSSLLSHQPFLSLILMCLKGQDEQREGLLRSLHSQISQCLHVSKDDKHGLEEIKTKKSMQDALQLRLSLLGGMFDMIQKSNSLTTDWSLLFVQLISYGVVDPQINYELFTTVLDMLAALIHTTQVSDTSSSDRGEETRKQYLNLVKKLKKELADKNNKAILMVRQLLPLAKQQCEVITCEAMGSLIDTKGNKIAGFDSIDKKQGLQVSVKQRVSPWDLLEGHKNPAPLSWAWFCAIRMERKPLRHEESHRLLLWHTHSMKKPSSYYLEPPPLPPEDLLEPPPEKQPQILIEDVKRGRDTPLEQSPRGNAKKPKQQQRRRRAAKMQGHSIRPGMGFPDQMMYQQGPPQHWYGQQPQIQQPPYYSPQQQLPPGGPRFERPLSQSKQALSSMLRARHPSSQFLPGPGSNPQHQTTSSGGGSAVTMPGNMSGGHMGGPGGGGPMQGHPSSHPGGSGPGPFPLDMMPKRQQLMMRPQMRPQGIPGAPANMYPHGMQPSSGPAAPLHHLPPQGMNQGYGSYGGGGMQPSAGMMESRNTTMMSGGYNQSYGNPQTAPSMMAPSGIRGQQGQYMSQSGRSQYPLAQGGMQAPNVTVNQIGSGSHLPVSGSGMVQGSGTSGYSSGPSNQANMSGMSGGPPGQMQHMQQLCHQQQLMAMQKQQHQQQHPQQQQQQQQTAALVAHLRHMGSSNQGPPHPQQQHHPYHQQGPY